MPTNFKTNIQSDIQSETHHTLQSLDWVGMGQIESAIRIGDIHIPCAISMVVNLREGNRGIHMSRLYALMTEQFLNKDLSEVSLQNFLRTAIVSQEGLSDQAGLEMKFKFPVKTKALKSGIAGHRNYDITIAAVQNTEGYRFWLGFEIVYSSTCPQSAALSLETFKNKINQGLDVKAMDRLPATPHAQRSIMTCELVFNTEIVKVPFDQFILQQIQQVEMILKTPVQTAVKKADELAFAELNSENLMFVEDAVRKVDDEFSKNSLLIGYKIKTRHEESLHPHNAISSKMHNYKSYPF